jgi:hypothetical protein
MEQHRYICWVLGGEIVVVPNALFIDFSSEILKGLSKEIKSLMPKSLLGGWVGNRLDAPKPRLVGAEFFE